MMFSRSVGRLITTDSDRTLSIYDINLPHAHAANSQIIIINFMETTEAWLSYNGCRYFKETGKNCL